MEKRARKRTYNTRLIRATWPYTVQEIADLFGIHKNVVLRWLKAGLVADRSTRPFLIRGTELSRFLSDRRAKRRQKCAPAEFYCFKCRSARGAYLNIADITIESVSVLRVKAICAVCSTPVSKAQAVRDLRKIRDRFAIQQMTGEHLLERAAPSVKVDSETPNDDAR